MGRSFLRATSALLRVSVVRSCSYRSLPDPDPHSLSRELRAELAVSNRGSVASWIRTPKTPIHFNRHLLRHVRDIERHDGAPVSQNTVVHQQASLIVSDEPVQFSIHKEPEVLLPEADQLPVNPEEGSVRCNAVAASWPVKRMYHLILVTQVRPYH